MSQSFYTRLQRLAFGFLATTAMFVVTTLQAVGGSAPQAVATPDSLPSVLTAADTTAAGQLIRPEDLARLLADSTARRPALLQVGFKVLYRSGHIPRSRYIGPASKPEGLAALKKALRGIPRQQRVVLYCGCCPWTDCPNARPAYRVAREMGFKNVRILYVAKNLQHDWIDKGLAISQGDQ
jgi:3-mercaptopyruvate sulfurtransferase SseA